MDLTEEAEIVMKLNIPLATWSNPSTFQIKERKAMLQLLNNLRLRTHQCIHIPGETFNLLLIKKHYCLELSHLPSLIGLVTFHTHLEMMLRTK